MKRQTKEKIIGFVKRIIKYKEPVPIPKMPQFKTIELKTKFITLEPEYLSTDIPKRVVQELANQLMESGAIEISIKDYHDPMCRVNQWIINAELKVISEYKDSDKSDDIGYINL